MSKEFSTYSEELKLNVPDLFSSVTVFVLLQSLNKNNPQLKSRFYLSSTPLNIFKYK